jgi:tetratricopeptide (TPR) repeat protein
MLGLVGAMAAMAAEKPRDKDKDKKDEKPPVADPATTECKLPFRPATVLNGAAATEEQVDAYYSAVRRYQEQLAAYRACIDKKIEAAKKAGDRVQLEALNKQYDDSISSEEQVVNAFNAAFNAYKALRPPVPGVTRAGTQADDAARYKRCLGQVPLNAQTALESALKWIGEGGGAPAKHCHALALMAVGQPAEAATRLEALAKARGAFGDELRQQILDQAGNAWLIAGNVQAAVADFTAALELARLAKLGPAAQATALGDRARAQILAGKLKEARADLNAAIALVATPGALVTLARLERQAGELGAAQADIAHALRLDPKFAEAFLERGRLRLLAPDPDAARQDFVQASLLAGSGPIADEAQREIEKLDVKQP